MKNQSRIEHSDWWENVEAMHGGVVHGGVKTQPCWSSLAGAFSHSRRWMLFQWGLRWPPKAHGWSLIGHLTDSAHVGRIGFWFGETRVLIVCNFLGCYCVPMGHLTCKNAMSPQIGGSITVGVLIRRFCKHKCLIEINLSLSVYMAFGWKFMGHFEIFPKEKGQIKEAQKQRE